MAKSMTAIEKNLLSEIMDLEIVPEGAYNIRANGESAARHTTANIDIVTKTDKPGIDIIIKPGTKNERVDIPVLLTKTGLKDLVYNDFYIGEDADVLIVAGCGIHNAGDEETAHDGIHSFHVGKNAKLKYVESTTARARERVSACSIPPPRSRSPRVAIWKWNRHSWAAWTPLFA